MPIQVFGRAAANAEPVPSPARRADTPLLVDVKGSRFAGCRVLMVPGLFGSGPDHWQSDWQRRYPRFDRVEQDDWTWPNLERWSRRVVETAIQAEEPVILVAHSFGCLATVRASVFQSNLIAGALLVAPADPARFKVEAKLPQGTLDFPTTLVASTNDPWMPLDRAQAWAERWGSDFVQLDGAGHVNVKSGFREWPLGLELLDRLCRHAQPHDQQRLAADVRHLH